MSDGGFRSWLALGMSMLAVVFSGLQRFEAHQQKSLSMRPSVDFDTEDDSTSNLASLTMKSNTYPASTLSQ